MGNITDQVHTKFKLFTGALDQTGHIGRLADEVAAWAKAARVAPKSIGIEFVEKSKQLSAEALKFLPPMSPLWREAARTAMMAGASTARHRDS